MGQGTRQRRKSDRAVIARQLLLQRITSEIVLRNAQINFDAKRIAVANLNPSDFGILVMNNRYLSVPVVTPGYELNGKRLKNLVGQGRLYVQVRGFKNSDEDQSSEGENDGGQDCKGKNNRLTRYNTKQHSRSHHHTRPPSASVSVPTNGDSRSVDPLTSGDIQTISTDTQGNGDAGPHVPMEPSVSSAQQTVLDGDYDCQSVGLTGSDGPPQSVPTNGNNGQPSVFPIISEAQHSSAAATTGLTDTHGQNSSILANSCHDVIGGSMSNHMSTLI
ncbi:uncharacterized protein [Ptychodera flava]|uniref:uncharacterized protein isoform X3 n=1 Tax=Ptychodera flava TaxID=63121 RepID=UPI00396AAA5D